MVLIKEKNMRIDRAKGHGGPPRIR